MKNYIAMSVILGLILVTCIVGAADERIIKVVPPIYVPVASYYKDGKWLHSEVISDDVFTTLHECLEKTQAAITHVMQSPDVPTGAGLKIACLPVPSLLPSGT